MNQVREHSNRRLTSQFAGTWAFCAMGSTRTSSTHPVAINPIVIKREDGS